MVAVIGDTPYNIVLVVHILSASVAFAPAFVHPLLMKQSSGMDPGSRQALMGYIGGNARRIYGPALIVNGLLGFALSGMSDGVYALSQAWLIVAIVVWIAMNGLIHAVLMPAERAMAAGDNSLESRFDIAGPVVAILLVVMLVLMVFKPGA